nr:hypothetical protein BaRGS_012512 [Batillaria attramentaria]
MEGSERANVEARIQWLRDIQALLDGAMVLIGQYNQVAASMGMSGIQVPPPSQEAPQAPSTATSTATAAPTWRPHPQDSAAQKNTTKPATLNSSVNASSTVKTSPSVTSVGSASTTEEKLDFSGLEGATGFTAPREMEVPEWEDPREEEHEDEMHEVRRRRLQRFSQDHPSGNTDNLDLD